MGNTNNPNTGKNTGVQNTNFGTERKGMDKSVAGGKQNIGGRDPHGKNMGQGQGNQTQQSRNQGKPGQGGQQGNNSGTGKTGW